MLVFFGCTAGHVQGHSAISPGGVWGTTYGTWTQVWVWCVQGKCLTHYTFFLAPYTLYWGKPCSFGPERRTLFFLAVELGLILSIPHAPIPAPWESTEPGVSPESYWVFLRHTPENIPKAGSWVTSYPEPLRNDEPSIWWFDFWGPYVLTVCPAKLTSWELSWVSLYPTPHSSHAQAKIRNTP